MAGSCGQKKNSFLNLKPTRTENPWFINFNNWGSRLEKHKLPLRSFHLGQENVETKPNSKTSLQWISQKTQFFSWTRHGCAWWFHQHWNACQKFTSTLKPKNSQKKSREPLIKPGNHPFSLRRFLSSRGVRNWTRGASSVKLIDLC